MRVIDYTVLYNTHLSNLIINVNELISKGYTPQGGIIRDQYFYQAMVKYFEGVNE